MSTKRIPIKFLELHESIFLGAKNYPPKLDAEKQNVLIVRYLNEYTNEIHLLANGVGTTIPFSMVKQAQPYSFDEADMEFEPKVKPEQKTKPAPVPQGRIKAQVSAPQGIKI